MIAVVFALEFEGAAFCARHEPRLRLMVWNLGSMGGAAIDAVEKKLEKERPDILVSAGFAGGLQPDFAVGDLVIGENYSDPGILAGLNLDPTWKVGKLETVPKILEKAADKRRLAEATGAAIADMETAHIARLCQSRGIRMLSVRCISDAANDDMPVPAELLLNPSNGRPEPLGLFRHLVSNPGAAPGFGKLVKSARIAQSRLADGLEEILPQVLRLS